MFKLIRLSLNGKCEGQSFSYSFADGINYFKGKNDSGKTEFYTFLDYMLGANINLADKDWFRDSLISAELMFLYNNRKFVVTRFISNPNKNFFRYYDEESSEEIRLDEYRAKLNVVFSKSQETMKEDKYPLIPFLVIDHISKPFDDKNQKALGAILHGAYTNLQKSEMQIILFDDEDASSLGLTPDHSINLLGEDKSGFNPFYMPSKEDSPNAPEEVE